MSRLLALLLIALLGACATVRRPGLLGWQAAYELCVRVPACAWVGEDRRKGGQVALIEQQDQKERYNEQSE